MTRSATTAAHRERPRLSSSLLGLLLLVFAVYAPTLGNGFAFDGRFIAKARLPYGEPNAMTAELRPLGDYFRANYWAGNIAGADSRLYRPVTILSFAITNALTGGVDADPAWEAVPHHLVNVLLKVWSVLLAYLLIGRFAGGWPAWIGAAVFGCHALHSEVVAGLVGRAELLAFCCGAQALLLLLPLRRPASRAGAVARGAAVVTLLFLAYCAKESAVAWCPLAILFAWLTADRPWRAALRTTLLAVPPLLVFLWLRHSVVAGQMDMRIHYLANPLWFADTPTRIRSAVVILAYGLYKCVWPMQLTSDYGPVTFALSESFADPHFLGAAILLTAALVLGLAAPRRRPLVFLATALFFGFTFLVSNIPLAIGTVFGERLYFAPSLGVAMLVAWLATSIAERLETTAARTLSNLPVGAWLLACCVVILRNNSAWHDEDSRILRDVQSNPRCLRTLELAARTRAARGDDAAAEATYRRALELDPDFQSGLTEYALFLARRQRFAEAEQHLLRALDVPDHHDRNPHITHYNLVALYEQTGQRDKMLHHLRRAWTEDAAYLRPHEPLIGPTLRLLPAPEQRAILGRAAALAPGDPTFAQARGQLALNSGDPVTAEREFRRVRSLRPAHHGARFGLGVALQQQGERAAARTILAALRDDPNAPPHLREQAALALR